MPLLDDTVSSQMQLGWRLLFYRRRADPLRFPRTQIHGKNGVRDTSGIDLTCLLASAAVNWFRLLLDLPCSPTVPYHQISHLSGYPPSVLVASPTVAVRIDRCLYQVSAASQRNLCAGAAA